MDPSSLMGEDRMRACLKKIKKTTRAGLGTSSSQLDDDEDEDSANDDGTYDLSGPGRPSHVPR